MGIPETWDVAFEEILRGRLPRIGADKLITYDLDLRASGLDSLGVVELLIDLEQSYAVTVPDHLLVPDTFATPESLWRVIRSLRGAKKAVAQ
jgi:diaminopimelate decarboxylase